MYILRLLALFVFFFFKQKTAYEMRISDWSSDVCSSDLAADRPRPLLPRPAARPRTPDRRPAVQRRQHEHRLQPARLRDHGGAMDAAGGGRRAAAAGSAVSFRPRQPSGEAAPRVILRPWRSHPTEIGRAHV